MTSSRSGWRRWRSSRRRSLVAGQIKQVGRKLPCGRGTNVETVHTSYAYFPNGSTSEQPKSRIDLASLLRATPGTLPSSHPQNRAMEPLHGLGFILENMITHWITCRQYRPSSSRTRIPTPEKQAGYLGKNFTNVGNSISYKTRYPANSNNSKPPFHATPAQTTKQTVTSPNAIPAPREAPKCPVYTHI